MQTPRYYSYPSAKQELKIVNYTSFTSHTHSLHKQLDERQCYTLFDCFCHQLARNSSTANSLYLHLPMSSSQYTHFSPRTNVNHIWTFAGFNELFECSVQFQSADHAYSIPNNLIAFHDTSTCYLCL